MTITQVSAENLKGRTFSHSLGAINVICGANNTGKTAIRDAIVLGLLGQHPQLGKTNPAIFQLSSAGVMSTSLTLDNGAVVERTWTQKAASVKSTESGSEHLPEVPLVLMDANQFLGASKPARIRQVFELAHVVFEPEKLRQEILAEASPDLKEVLVECLAYAEGERENPQKWLSGAIFRINDEINTVNNTIKRLGNTGAGMSQLAAEDTIVSEDDVSRRRQALNQRSSELERARGELDAHAAESQRQAAAYQEWERKLNEKGLALAGKTAREVQTIEYELTVARNDERIVSEDLYGYQLAKRDFDSLGQKRANLQAQLESTKRELKECRTDKERIQIQTGILEFADQQIATARYNTERWNELQRQIAAKRAEHEVLGSQIVGIKKRETEFGEAKCCPTCHASGTGWKDRVLTELTAERELPQAASKALFDELEELRQASDSLYGHRTAGVDRDAIVIELRRLESNADLIPGLQSRLAQLERELESTAEAAVNPPVAPNGDVEGIRSVIREKEAELKTARAFEDLNNFAAAAPPRPSENQIGTETSDLAWKFEALQTERTEVERLEQLVANQAADARRIQQALDERTKEEANLEALKKIKEKLDAERKDLVEKAIIPLLTKVQAFTQDILPTPMEFRDGDLGRFEDGSWIPLACFSGTHMAVASAALQAALGASSPARIVIVDELGRFDHFNKIQFLHNVNRSIAAGIIDQFIGIDVTQDPYFEIPGVNFIKTGDTK